VRVGHVGGLSTVKVPEHRHWLDANARRYEEKWGSLPPERARFRRRHGDSTWHFCQNCPDWPVGDVDEAPPVGAYGADKPPRPPDGNVCGACEELRESRGCAFY
jgi:hypothetical protein